MTNCKHCGHVIEMSGSWWIHSDTLKRMCWRGNATATPS